MGREVVALAGAPPTWKQSLLVACWSTKPQAVASHRSAMRLWGMRSVDNELEVTVRYPRQPRISGAAVHRSVDLALADVSWVDGIPVTSPVRTLVDAGLHFPLKEVRRMIYHAIATELVTRGAVADFRRRVGRQGRNGVGAIDAVLDTLPLGAEDGESGPEAELLAICEQAGLPRPARQAPVIIGGRRYRIDLAYPEHRIAIEYDGFKEHTTPERFARDRQRQNDLVLHGWVVLRFSAVDLGRPAMVAAAIRSALPGFLSAGAR